MPSGTGLWLRAGRDYDISTRVLREAMHTTSRGVVEPVPAPLHTYLRRSTGARAGYVRVVPALRAKVRFGHLNFMASRYPLPGRST